MNYELTLKLKEAGLPLRKMPPGKNDEDEEVYGIDGFYWYVPALSELIEACGNMFVLHSPGSLDVNEEYYVHGDVWTAYSQRKETNCHSEGSTPEEAVAKLWLQLNTK